MPRNKKEGSDKRRSAECGGNKFSFCAITLTLINTPPSLKKVTSGAERAWWSLHHRDRNILRVRRALGRNVCGHTARLKECAGDCVNLPDFFKEIHEASRLNL